MMFYPLFIVIVMPIVLKAPWQVDKGISLALLTLSPKSVPDVHTLGEYLARENFLAAVWLV